MVNNLSRFPLMSFSSKPGKLVCLKATSTLTCDDQESNRVFKKLPLSDWNHHFLSVHLDVTEVNALWKEIEAIKPKVLEMFMSSNDVESAKQRILLIYLLVSLGVGYHFEDEIEETVKESLQKINEMMAGENDLYTISIIFWVFRTYGHNISSDVFKRFKGSNGKFKESLLEDVMGMLSLYEAAHLMTTTDYIMEEALSFASSHLESLAVGRMCPPHITRRIRNALCISQNKNLEILVALEYIRFYEQEDDYDEILLKFSKLNFRLLQLHYLQELRILTKWYKDQEFASKLPPYYRDRIVEMHLISLAYFEPKFSRARIMLTKLFTVQIFIDDTCDRYASLCEVESLANAIERWDPEDAMDTQPTYLKFVFKFVLDTFKEFEREVGSELEGSYSVEATIEECKKFMKSDLEFAKWAAIAQVPSFEEYLAVGGVEMGTYLTLAGAFMGMEHIRTKEAYDWLKSRTKLVKLVGAKARILNDTTGFEHDMRRESVTNAVTYYMKQYGVTEKESFKKLYQMVANIDKVMNEEFLKTDDVPRQIMNVVINCARMVNISYNVEDGFTNPDGNFKDHITSLYFD